VEKRNSAWGDLLLREWIPGGLLSKSLACLTRDKVEGRWRTEIVNKKEVACLKKGTGRTL
jgi:hypothetical protein